MGQQQKNTAVSPQPHRPSHVLLAFLAAAAGTNPRDASNRSIGQIDCVEITRDAPDKAAGIVACNRVIDVDALCV